MVVGRKKNGGYTWGIARETNNLVARESNRVTWWGFHVWVLSVVVGGQPGQGERVAREGFSKRVCPGCRGRATAPTGIPTGYSLRGRHMKGREPKAFIALSLWASNASRKSTLALSLAKYLQVPIETIDINRKPLTGGSIPVTPPWRSQS